MRFEPAVALGTKVDAGDLAGWHHGRERIADTGQPLHFAESGIAISGRLHCESQAGEAQSATPRSNTTCDSILRLSASAR